MAKSAFYSDEFFFWGRVTCTSPIFRPFFLGFRSNPFSSPESTPVPHFESDTGHNGKGWGGVSGFEWVVSVIFSVLAHFFQQMFVWLWLGAGSWSTYLHRKFILKPHEIKWPFCSWRLQTIQLHPHMGPNSDKLTYSHPLTKSPRYFGIVKEFGLLVNFHSSSIWCQYRFPGVAMLQFDIFFWLCELQHSPCAHLLGSSSIRWKSWMNSAPKVVYPLLVAAKVLTFCVLVVVEEFFVLKSAMAAA